MLINFTKLPPHIQKALDTDDDGQPQGLYNRYCNTTFDGWVVRLMAKMKTLTPEIKTELTAFILSSKE